MAEIKAVKEFFGYATLTEFRNEWAALSEEDRTQIRLGLGDGSLSY
ncbi:MAG TPA: hypothetical protein VHB18_05200 [Mycobacteriales bacterium]|jgi:hypothetical protein|nr:hypothetical protein [Mycobacteriales bacterium]